MFRSHFPLIYFTIYFLKGPLSKSLHGIKLRQLYLFLNILYELPNLYCLISMLSKAMKATSMNQVQKQFERTSETPFTWLAPPLNDTVLFRCQNWTCRYRGMYWSDCNQSYFLCQIKADFFLLSNQCRFFFSHQI